MATAIKTSAGYETPEQTAARIKAALGDAYDPNTQTPTQERVDEISNQSFVDPNIKADYDASKESYNAKLNPTNDPQHITPTNINNISASQLQAILNQTDKDGNPTAMSQQAQIDLDRANDRRLGLPPGTTEIARSKGEPIPGGDAAAQTTAIQNQTAPPPTGIQPPGAPTAPTAPSGFTPSTYSPYNPGTSNVDQYYQNLISAHKPSQQYIDAQSQQDALAQQQRNLNRSQELTNNNLDAQPIARGFITGQQTEIAKDFALDRGVLADQQQTQEQKLARLQQQQQSAIDVASAGVDYGQYLDTRADNTYQNNFSNQLAVDQFNQLGAQHDYQNQYNAYQDSLAASQYQDQQAQQQYLNTTDESRYEDDLKQQQIENSLDQQRINNSKKSTDGLSDAEKAEIKEQDKLVEDAKGLRGKLATGDISWADAWNQLHAEYPKASNEALDKLLDKKSFDTVTTRR